VDFHAERSAWAFLPTEVVDGRDHLFDDQAAVADDRHIRHPNLAHFGRVDVDVDDLGFLGESVEATGDPVVEASPRAMSRSDFCIAVTAV